MRLRFVRFTAVIVGILLLSCPAARADDDIPALQAQMRAAVRRGDDATVLRLVERLAAMGVAPAQVLQAQRLLSAKDAPADPAAAARWLRRAADQGYAPAQRELGRLYAEGRGVPKNPVESTRWLRQAALQGDVEAEVAYGAALALGQGVPRNDAEAVRWLRRAADRGDANGQYNLGVLHVAGQGVPEDTEAAARWFRLAAAQGHEPAKERLRQLVAEKSAVPAPPDAMAPLGLVLGRTMLGEAKAMLEKKTRLIDDGINAYSRGPMLKGDGHGLGINGLQAVTLIFDRDQRLAAVMLRLPKARFDDIYEHLKSKYALEDQKIPFVGDRFARFRQGDSTAELNAPHLSFAMDVLYARDAFMSAYEQQSRASREGRRNTERTNF